MGKRRGGSYLPSCRGPGSRVNALQDKGTGWGGIFLLTLTHLLLSHTQGNRCVPGPTRSLRAEGAAGGREGPRTFPEKVTLGK